MNRLICGDNLDVLPTLEDESVDLSYGDPPFFSGETYEVIWGDNAEVRSFEDRFKGGINNYIEWMRPRIQEIHRALKKTGSFYLHCDWHADAYLRVLCDQIFGQENLLNRIIWQRTSAHNDPHKFGRNSDTILFYVKSLKEYKFYPVYVDRNEEYVKKVYRYTDGGGVYRLADLTAAGANPNDPEWRGYDPKVKGVHWRANKESLIDLVGFDVWKEMSTEEKLETLYQNDLIIFGKNGYPSFKRYLNDKGQACQEIWNDISVIGAKSRERLGYPTQKPEALLERIINASSNEGDVVFDAWAGCGTTLAVANRIGRQFIGIDISPTACRLVANRVGMPISEIEGYPMSADEIAALKPFEFQNWVCLQMNAVVSARKSGDMGIDGKCRLTNVPLQVKQSQVGRPVLDAFKSAISRAGIEKGAIVGTSIARNAWEEAARLKSEGVEIFLYVPQDLIDGKPFADGVSKHAMKAY